MIRVLIVEDSAVQRELLDFILTESGEFSVVGVATDGIEAISRARQLEPDVILMDLHMPRMDGIAAAREIMIHGPIPIVIASATMHPDDIAATFEATKVGVLAIVAKPTGPGDPNYSEHASRICQTLKLMSAVKVVRRRNPETRKVDPENGKKSLSSVPVAPRISLVAIGGSTGAPPIVAEILGGLPEDIEVPVLVVQHLAAGFLDGYVTWLARCTLLKVEIGSDGTRVRNGVVYVAPDGAQMGIDLGRRLTVSQAAKENGFCPSASYLFRSVAESFGPAAIGIVLSGMGADGAAGLLAMRNAGAVTIAQDEETCVVFGMPKAAIERSAVSFVLPPTAISDAIRMAAKSIKQG